MTRLPLQGMPHNHVAQEGRVDSVSDVGINVIAALTGRCFNCVDSAFTCVLPKRIWMES